MLTTLGAAALDLLAAPVCAGCGGRSAAVRVDADLCDRCRAQLRSAAPIAWSLRRPGEHDPGRPQLIPAFAAAPYEDLWRGVLLAYKERGRVGLRAEIGSALSVACLAACLDGSPELRGLAPPAAPMLLVPIPSRPSTVRERGHDAVRTLAGVAAANLRQFGWPTVSAPVLRHVREVADQSGLSLAMRATNLAGALGVRRGRLIDGRSVVVVDDIVTTGATAAEAARVLTSRGAIVRAVAAVAATPRRWPPADPAAQHLRTDAARRVEPG